MRVDLKISVRLFKIKWDNKDIKNVCVFNKKATTKIINTVANWNELFGNHVYELMSRYKWANYLQVLESAAEEDNNLLEVILLDRKLVKVKLINHAFILKL